MQQNIIRIGNIEIGNQNPFVLIGGPDSLESYERTFPIVSAIKSITDTVGVPYILKASYDKANRTSVNSFRGIGLARGLELLSRFKKELHVPVTTDVHSPEEARAVGEVVDLIQIPALLSRQTDLIIAAAMTGKPINVKKGQFMSPYDMKNVLEKASSVKNTNVMLTERGFSFGYGQLIADMRSLEIMKQTGAPVIFDAAHTVQLPSGLGITSGGAPEFIAPLARAAIAVGIAGLFLEIYDDPDSAPVDGKNSLPLAELESLLRTLTKIDRILKS